MNHVLDNPIWNALTTGSRQVALGSENAKYIRRDVGVFAGLKSNSEDDLKDLHRLAPEKSIFILFTLRDLSVPPGWRTVVKKDLLQMVYLQPNSPSVNKNKPILLRDDDVQAMLDLTALTNPGPFLSRTIELGNYEGIFDQDNLVAMSGQRLQPDPYTEISAVCTHPDYTGKGYAAELIGSQIRKIRAMSRIPFLHAHPDNVAVKLYEKLGFQVRKHMLVYAIEKKG